LKQYAIRPFSLLSASEQNHSLWRNTKVVLAFIMVLIGIAIFSAFNI